MSRCIPTPGLHSLAQSVSKRAFTNFAVQYIRVVVGAGVGEFVGGFVGGDVGTGVGGFVGGDVGAGVGEFVGGNVGRDVGGGVGGGRVGVGAGVG